MVNKSFKIYITNVKRKLVSLDIPLTLNACHKIYLKSVKIFWDYNNLDTTYFYNYDVDAANTKVAFKKGYYTFDTLKKEFENTGKIELEKKESTGKCKLCTDKKMNLKTLGPLLGFSENKEIAANTWVTSENKVNINNNLEFVNMYCNLINASRNFTDGKRSNILIQIPIPSDRTLKGSVSKFSKEEKEGIMLSNGIYNEMEFLVEGNNSKEIGKILLDFYIK